MHLMFTLDASGSRVYTLKKVVGAEVTRSAHPARFSPDDKYSRYAMCTHDDCLIGLAVGRNANANWSRLGRHRVTLKKRYGLLMTQTSE